MRHVPDRIVRATAAAALPALATLALAGCGDDGGSSSGNSPSTAAQTIPALPSTAAPTATDQGKMGQVNVTVTIAGGKVSGGIQTVKADVGRTVKVTVTSDVADEVHVHGYDKEFEVGPGSPGSVVFTADTKGTFEIETHETGKLLAKLVVS